METINIINNFDQNILMENILILNQKKLLDMVINVFEKDFADKSDDGLTIYYVKEYFNSLNFINWELFIRLLNLKTTFAFGGDYYLKNVCSIVYLIGKIGSENKSTKIIEFLLKLPRGTVNWDIKIDATGTNVLRLLLCFKKFYENSALINMFFDSDLFDKQMWREKNFYCEAPVDIIVNNCSEELIIRAIELGIIEVSSNIIGAIKSEKIILHLMEKQNITLNNDIFYLAVENNWTQIIEYYFSHGFIDWNILNGPYVVFWLLCYFHYKYAQIVLHLFH
jgi:hypothetical protein